MTPHLAFIEFFHLFFLHVQKPQCDMEDNGILGLFCIILCLRGKQVGSNLGQ